MSLLMDALKRAEEEKKRLDREGPLNGSVAGEPGPAESAQTDSLPLLDESEDKTIEAGTQLTSEFTLEPLDAPAESAEPTVPSQIDPASSTSALSATTPSVAREAAQELLIGADGEPMRPAPANASGRDATRASVRASNARSQPETDSLDATQASVRTRHTEFDFGDISTRVAADTIFTAQRGMNGARLLRLGGLALASVLAALAGVGLYLELNIPGPVALAPQTESRELGRLPAPLVTPAVARLSPTALPVSGPVGMHQPAFASPEPTRLAATGSNAPTSVPVATPVAANSQPVPESAQVAEVSTEPASVADNEQNSLSPPPRRPRSPSGDANGYMAADAFGADGYSGFQIARVPARTTVATLVDEAYSAYRIGSFTRAEYLYQSVLAEAPSNRDALLGLGAINMQRGARDRAYQYYRQALDSSPNDAVATAALFSLSDPGRESVSEDHLRALASANASAPELQFSLGNSHAREGRWSDAQQAYFSAFSGDAHNADYAFNLAVSLDHLGQGKAALDYYRKALSLSQLRPGQFDPSRARARADALSIAISQK